MAAFTTIATIGAAAIGSGMSFAEAGKQRKIQSEAEKAAQKAFDELNWNPKFGSLEEIIESAWTWHKKYPNGYTV